MRPADARDGLHEFYQEVEDAWYDEHTSLWLARWATGFESLLIGPGEGDALDILEQELFEDDSVGVDMPISP